MPLLFSPRRLTLLLVGALALGPGVGPGTPAARAQHVPVRRYDVADGLGHSRVTHVLQDHLGYLWMATWEGLSRFDGYRFTTYGQAEGLRNPSLFQLAEDSFGRIWVGNWGAGLARLDDMSSPGGHAHFTLFPLPGDDHDNEISRVAADRSGHLWVLSTTGMFRADVAGDSARITRLPAGAEVNALAFDEQGELWVGRGRDLCRWRDDAPVPVGRPPELPHGVLIEMAPAPGHRMLVADSTHVYEVTLPAPGAAPGVAAWRELPLTIPPTVETREIRCLLADSTGSWVGTRDGLIHWDGARETWLTRREGLADNFIRTLFRDGDGNLWVGTDLLGVSCLSTSRVANYLDDPGTPDRNIVMSLAAPDGRIWVVTSSSGLAELVEGQPRRLPASQVPPFRALNYRLVRDDTGAWWAGTDVGLYRSPGPEPDFARARRFGPAEGLPQELVLGVWHDPVTRLVWVGSTGGGVYRADARAGADARFTRLPLPPLPPTYSAMRQFGRDAAGNVWMAGFRGLLRWRHERADIIAAGHGLPENQARCLFTDRRGRLWLGLRNQGVVVCDDPDAEIPIFRNITVADGLPSNAVWWITDDAAGDLYLATGRGLARLPLDGGPITALHAADGLPGEMVQHVRRDAEGRIWAATAGGLARVDPGEPPHAGPPPPIFLSHVTVAGEEQPLPERGVMHFGPLVLPPGRNNLRVDYVGLRYGGRADLRYEYRLLGAEPDFGPPTDQLSVNYARLAPGRYRFEVRAIDNDGRRSRAAAALDFRVTPPFWRRPAFVALLLALAGFLTYLVVRFRVRQLLALERLRRQIALDLHDEVGSGLAQITILNEVARRETSAASADLLDQSTTVARQLRASMGDIVWAVDPRRDRLLDLVQRVRQFAFSLFEGGAAEVLLHAPYDEVMAAVPLGPDKRRHLLLIIKEALTNVARHAGATRVELTLAVEGRQLELTIADNGRGFTPADVVEGNGLGSLRRRAAELGGALTLDARPGGGTTVRLVAPLTATPPRMNE